MPTNTTELFGLLSFLAILALFLHSVWKFSRRFPNADERAPTGVDGGLLLLMTASRSPYVAAGPVGAGLLPWLRGDVEWAFTLSISAFSLWGAFYALKSVRARHVFG